MTKKSAQSWSMMKIWLVRCCRNTLADYPNVEIVGECSSGKQAVKTINSLQPDLIFLDVQMPELSGFGVIKKLKKIPFVIFSTAYDKYALQAFEVNAVDYLLKPYDRERFNQAMQRVLERIKNDTPPNEQLRSLINSIQIDQADTQRIWIKENGSLKPIKLQEIDWIEAMDELCLPACGKGKSFGQPDPARIRSKTGC